METMMPFIMTQIFTAAGIGMMVCSFLIWKKHKGNEKKAALPCHRRCHRECEMPYGCGVGKASSGLVPCREIHLSGRQAGGGKVSLWNRGRAV